MATFERLLKNTRKRVESIGCLSFLGLITDVRAQQPTQASNPLHRDRPPTPRLQTGTLSILFLTSGPSVTEIPRNNVRCPKFGLHCVAGLICRPQFVSRQ